MPYWTRWRCVWIEHLSACLLSELRPNVPDRRRAENNVMASGHIIITCAVTGAIYTPTMSPHLPITPDEIVADAVAAA